MNRPSLDAAAELQHPQPVAGGVQCRRVRPLVDVARVLEPPGLLPLGPHRRPARAGAPLRPRRPEHRVRERLRARRAEACPDAPLVAPAEDEAGLGEGRRLGSNRARRLPEADDDRRPGRVVRVVDRRALDL